MSFFPEVDTDYPSLEPGQTLVAINRTQVFTDGVKRYVALLTQSGMVAPVATVLENTLGFTPIWLRLTEGEYSVAFSNGFPDNDKIFTIFPATYFDGGDVQTILMVSPNSPNSVAFHFFDTMEASKDAECFRLPVEIRVYP